MGDGLRSTTSTIGHSRVFNVGDTPVSLIDTPGFDDSEKSDVEILEIIAAYLSTSLVLNL